jgi:hypothetical protein
MAETHQPAVSAQIIVPHRLAGTDLAHTGNRAEYPSSLGHDRLDHTVIQPFDLTAGALME